MHYPELNAQAHLPELEGEIWKPIKGFEGHYEVSNLGRVRSLERMIRMKNQAVSYDHKKPLLVMKANNDSRGYPQVTLSTPVRRVARVHRLVAEAFLVPPSDDLVRACEDAGYNYVPVNHKDENKENPAANNLQWCTVSYNNAYSKGNVDYTKMSGSLNAKALLNEDQVTQIVALLKEGRLSQERIAELFDVKQITISNIKTGRSWAWFTGITRTARHKQKEAGVAIVEESCH